MFRFVPTHAARRADWGETFIRSRQRSVTGRVARLLLASQDVHQTTASFAPDQNRRKGIRATGVNDPGPGRPRRPGSPSPSIATPTYAARPYERLEARPVRSCCATTPKTAIGTSAMTQPSITSIVRKIAGRSEMSSMATRLARARRRAVAFVLHPPQRRFETEHREDHDRDDRVVEERLDHAGGHVRDQLAQKVDLPRLGRWCFEPSGRRVTRVIESRSPGRSVFEKRQRPIEAIAIQRVGQRDGRP